MIVFFAFASGIVAAPLLAVAFGILQSLRLIRGKQSVRNGPWTTRLTEGSREMTSLQRALIALTGLWALKSSEVVYFAAFQDSNGNRLRVGRTYRIEGGNLDTRWWAITAYKNFQLIANDQNRYSYSKTNIEAADEEAWTIRMSAAQMPGNWIPTGGKRGILVFSLRMYNPHPEVYENPSTIPLPRILVEEAT